MSYNIMGKNASFKGDISGTIENQVNDWDNQSISGSKSFAAAITSSADVMLSGSGKVSASFFYGDGSGLSGVATAAGLNRQVQFNNGGSALGASSNFTFTSADQLQVTGQISASLGVTGSEFHGDGSNLTAVTASFVTASNVVGILDASQINIGSGLEASSNSIQINLSSSTSGLLLDGDGLAVNPSRLTTTTAYADNTVIIVQGASDSIASKMAFSVLEADLPIAAPNLTGEINNARFPATINVPILSGAVAISGAFFHGNGAGLTGVTSTPTPAGSNTQIQFNNNGAIAADADLTFLTGSNTLATSNLSASVNISGSSLYLQDEIIVGGNTFLNSEGNIAIVNEITASGDISSSLDIHALNFRGDGSTLNNVPLGSSNAASIVFIDNETNKTITTNAAFTFNGTHAVNTGGGFKGTILSASADVQVGGHITGSGDIVLLGAGNSIIFDTASGTGLGPEITTAASNEMTIDGDNTVKIQADSYVVIRENTTSKVTFNFVDDFISVQMPLSSSQYVSASIIDSLTGYKLGDQTIIDSNGNLTVGSVEIVAGGSDIINFNDNSISGSGNISGSAFYGDGSNLSNLPSTAPSHRYAYFTNNSNITTSARFVDWLGPSNQPNLTNMRGGIIIAPTSGSIVRISFSPTDNINIRSDGDEMILGVTRNAVNTLSVAQANGKQLIGATGSFNKSISYYDDANGTTNTFTGEIDFVNGNNVTGSNSFDPGDILGFAFRTPAGTTNLCGITLVLKLEES